MPFFEAQNGILSASGVSTLYSINADAARIMSIDAEGGAIDNATIGATTQSSGKFTTLRLQALLILLAKHVSVLKTN